MTDLTTHMRREIDEIPEAAVRLLETGLAPIIEAAAACRELDPAFVATVARGSSDHVATFLKYACEIELGIPVASLGPSITSIYKRPLKLDGAAVISVSQSGMSPDIVETARAGAGGGALTIAMTNNSNSPLAEVSAHAIDIRAGLERSVAATKTVVISAMAGLALLAYWRQDDGLIGALRALPDQFAAALANRWSALSEIMQNRSSLYVLGRGASFAVSNEAALKFKETCQIHAESYSSAELLHGPVSIVEEEYPVLVFAARDAAEASTVAVADQLAEAGAQVYVTSAKASHAEPLDFTPCAHPLTDPLVQLVSFYGFIEELSRSRGLHPDTPRNLKKVTQTI